jgi:hypothetical protein
MRQRRAVQLIGGQRPDLTKILNQGNDCDLPHGALSGETCLVLRHCACRHRERSAEGKR